ncbi:unnamed protein product, partial [Dibothriocephalus latus]
AGDQSILEDAALGGLFTESLAGFSACPRCEGVRAKGLNEWMDHLGECHPVPSRWPSSKVDRLVAGQDLHHPYTTVVDSHKKRRRNVTPRPLNSFMECLQSTPLRFNLYMGTLCGKLSWLRNDTISVVVSRAVRH